jgi:2-desacetyl-2-hydroxyethyl bacteriochlorophyllide A dehydrogenase
MQRKSLIFLAPYRIEVITEACPVPIGDQLLITTLYSSISAGTELLFYRGQVPPNMTTDATISSLQQFPTYPLRYGYACVGRVTACGPNANPDWAGRLVFAFHPHATHFVAEAHELHVVPASVTAEQALFLPNMETAISLLHDGAPVIGERILVLGQGIVGLLVTKLLASNALDLLVTVDKANSRRLMSELMGATVSVQDITDYAKTFAGFDLVFELTGSPSALNEAIPVTAFSGRIVIGSWYGTKRVEIELGSSFHRSRIQLLSSQVSTLPPHLTGRWTKERRMQVAWRQLALLENAPLITHYISFDDAQMAYSLLDERPDQALQVLLDYT